MFSAFNLSDSPILNLSFKSCFDDGLVVVLVNAYRVFFVAVTSCLAFVYRL